MVAPTRVIHAEKDNLLNKAISAFVSEEYTCIRAYARDKGVPYPTLRYRLTSHTSRAHAMESRQNLSSTREETLVRWITRLTRIGFPASPTLVLEMAEEIRRTRVSLSSASPSMPSYTTLISRK